MTNKVEMFPLDSNALFFVIRDGSGRAIGSGSREVCEILLHIINRQAEDISPKQMQARVVRENQGKHGIIRSAIQL
jgi:hypothetical protein